MKRLSSTTTLKEVLAESDRFQKVTKLNNPDTIIVIATHFDRCNPNDKIPVYLKEYTVYKKKQQFKTQKRK